jgi:hypothetical protein
MSYNDSTKHDDKPRHARLAEIRQNTRKDQWHGELYQLYLTEQRRLGYAPQKRPCLLAVLDDGRLAYIRFARDGSQDTDPQVMRRLAAMLTGQADLAESSSPS